MKFFKKMVRKFEDEMAAAAFAQAGEMETAKEILKESDKQNLHNDISRGESDRLHLPLNPAENHN
ncbi:hypothetical protein BMS3Abin07_01499 [bacterium BMS3Abin07]|nr:hypothetical protein BMS3Abin07_01499 [bacterium BMS3Abin07]GBE32226.1 hypothetical protein BMS3Bbin05_01135 [bacterium BMS3Bbin05]HDL20682.1 hypothetical protein [Nitrospirota bacterium]HDO21999.1 hypothetical protein [Nitrospirota bacterium]HDZ87715.1 hypothetical protein [Nitrospirota bacterium]